MTLFPFPRSSSRSAFALALQKSLLVDFGREVYGLPGLLTPLWRGSKEATLTTHTPSIKGVHPTPLIKGMGFKKHLKTSGFGQLTP